MGPAWTTSLPSTALSELLPLSYCSAAVNLKDSSQFLPRALRVMAGQAGLESLAVPELGTPQPRPPFTLTLPFISERCALR